MRKKLSIAITSLILFACVAGCASKEGVFNVDQHADIPKGSIPEPAGRKLNAIVNQQILSADTDSFALYISDFVGQTSDLSPSANNRLIRLKANDALETSEIVIEPSGEDTLDSERIASVKLKLEQLGVWDITILLGKPPALPLTSSQIGLPNRSQSGISSGGRSGRSGLGGGGGGGGFPSRRSNFGSFLPR